MMTATTLQQLLDDSGDIVDLLRNQQTGPNVYPGVPGEYSNWRDEQMAWANKAVLFNQSFHMVDLAVEGPDAFAMLNHLGINSFKNFVPDRAKQFVPVTPDGYVIGDVILLYLAENKFNLVGRAPALNWVMFHAQTGKYDVKVELDQRSALRTD
jgi:syringate O-demethylase